MPPFGAIVLAALGVMACDQPTPPGAEPIELPKDTASTPSGVVELRISGAPTTISYPGAGRANLIVTRGAYPVSDDIAATVSVTGPFTTSWESFRWQLRTLKVTATDTGSGTITISTLEESVSFPIRAAAVDFKRIAMTSWASPTFGSSNGCGIATDDRVWCWGGNTGRQLGTSTPYQCSGGACQYGGVYDSPSPLPIETAQTFSQVVVTSYSCGAFLPGTCGRACGLTAAGEAWCWGDGFNTPARVAPTQTFRSVAVGGGAGYAGLAQSCGISPDDRAYCFTPTGTTAVAEGKAVRDMAIGPVHTCVVTVAGELWCWGTNYEGVLGVGNTDAQKYSTPQRVLSASTFVRVDISYYSSCALDTEGRIQCWGMGYAGDGESPPPSCGGINASQLCQTTPRPVANGGRYAALATSRYNRGVCGLTPSGSVDCWSTYNKSPMSIQLPEPIVSMTHGCGTSATGVTYCWSLESGIATKFR